MEMSEDMSQIKLLVDNEVYMNASMLIESVLRDMSKSKDPYDQEDYKSYQDAIIDYTNFFEDRYFEPMQWFFVSKYMHEKLSALHEVTFPMRGEYVWARQSIGFSLEEEEIMLMIVRGETYPESKDKDHDDIGC